MEGSSGSGEAAGKQPMELNLNDPKRMPSDIELLKGFLDYHAPLTETPWNMSTLEDFLKNWLSSSADPEDVANRYDLLACKYLKTILLYNGIPAPGDQEIFAYSHKLFGENAMDVSGSLLKSWEMFAAGEDSSAINAAGEENEILQTEAKNLDLNVVGDDSAMKMKKKSSSEKLGDEDAVGSHHQRNYRKFASPQEWLSSDDFILASIENYHKTYGKYPFKDAGVWSPFVRNWLFVNDSQLQTELENRIEEYKEKYLRNVSLKIKN